MKVIRVRAVEGMAEPVIDLIPDSAIQKSGKPFFVPDFAESFRFKAAAAVRICRLGKNIAEKFASRYYDEAGLCLALEAQDLLQDLQSVSAPWSLATAFDGAVILGDFFPVEDAELGKSEAVLTFDNVRADGCVTPAAPSFDKLIAYVSRYFTLKIGDYLLAECGEWHNLTVDSRICGLLNERESINIKVK